MDGGICINKTYKSCKVVSIPENNKRKKTVESYDYTYTEDTEWGRKM